MLSDDVKLQVKRATDIVDVIQSYIPLQKAGSSFKARCPFHEEKTRKKSVVSVNFYRTIFCKRIFRGTDNSC